MSPNKSRLILLAALIPVVTGTLLWQSANDARAICDKLLQRQIDLTPHRSTQLVLWPESHIRMKTSVGLHPGWVLTYANEQGEGVAFLVDFSGKIEQTGSPRR